MTTFFQGGTAMQLLTPAPESVNIGSWIKRKTGLLYIILKKMI